MNSQSYKTESTLYIMNPANSKTQDITQSFK